MDWTLYDLIQAHRDEASPTVREHALAALLEVCDVREVARAIRKVKARAEVAEIKERL